MNDTTNFENLTADERNNTIIQNAEYFTVFRMLGRQRQRVEAPTIEEARRLARVLISANASKPVLIYAVQGISDTFVESVKA